MIKNFKLAMFIVLFFLFGCNFPNYENNKIMLEIISENPYNSNTDTIILESIIAKDIEIITEKIPTEDILISDNINSVTEDNMEIEIDVRSKEKEITQIFLDNKADFEKIKDIITNNYLYFYIRYKGEEYIYNEISGGEDYETANDDVREKNYILNFMQNTYISTIQRPEKGAVETAQIIFYITYNNSKYQGIQYIYEPENDNYYIDFNENNLSILRRIEGNWFYFYNAPPD